MQKHLNIQFNLQQFPKRACVKCLLGPPEQPIHQAREVTVSCQQYVLLKLCHLKGLVWTLLRRGHGIAEAHLGLGIPEVSELYKLLSALFKEFPYPGQLAFHSNQESQGKFIWMAEAQVHLRL